MYLLRFDFFFLVQTKINFYVCLKTKLFLNFLLHFSSSFFTEKCEIFTHCDFYYYCLIKRYLIYFTEIYWHSKKISSRTSREPLLVKLTTNKFLNFRLSLLFSFLRWNFLLINFYFLLSHIDCRGRLWRRKVFTCEQIEQDWALAVAFAVMKNRRWEKKCALLSKKVKKWDWGFQ